MKINGHIIKRREFLGLLTCSAAALSMPKITAGASEEIPPHLRDYEKLYKIDPRAASRQWFREAGFGLFMHYGIYSRLGRGEWVMLREKIPVKEYEKLKDTFTADKFDADKITDLAIASEMKYVNITSRHHDSFCLFRTDETNFNSLESPAKRDLVAELADACRKKGLGLFLYYSYACDWRHPYFYAREAGWQSARPHYEKSEPYYLWRKDEDFKHYIKFVHNQLRELLTQYGPLAGIWFDPIMGYYARPDLFPVEETYRLVRSLQPHCLISFKQGANGDEDFATPERSARSLKDRVEKEYGSKNAAVAQNAWEKNRIKQLEICDTLLPRSWGYNKTGVADHRTPDDVMQMLKEAREIRANLLLNTGPIGDGSIHPTDKATLREVGKRIRKY